MFGPKSPIETGKEACPVEGSEPSEYPTDAGSQPAADVQRRIILVGHHTIHSGLEETEQREPDPRPSGIPLHQRLIIGECMIIEEQTRRYVESDEHIDGIMLVTGQDEKYSEHVEKPGERMQ